MSSIRQSSVLLVGMKSLGAEVAKNLVLTGIGRLCLVDPELVSQEDLEANFLLNDDSLGLNVCRFYILLMT